jgi:hypothetical protein
MVHLCIQERQFEEGRRVKGYRNCRMTLMYVCELKIDVIFGTLLSHSVLLEFLLYMLHPTAVV